MIEKQLNPEIKKNTFHLIKEYKNSHEVTSKYNKYNRIPNYLEEEENNYYLNINCQIKGRISKYYNSFSDQIIDNDQILSFFLRKHYYYNSFPMIFINSEYYKQFLDFLSKCPKYKKFNFMENLNIKLILSSENNYEYKHTIDNIDINLIADVVENVNLYKTEEIIKAIKIIKLSKKGDYKEIINEWVMIIMDILVEFYLFILNKKPYYCICQYCNNPILYTYFENNLNKKSINSENNILSIESSLAQFNEYNKVDFDNSIYKSMKICSNLNNIFFSNNFFKNPIEDYKKKYENLNNNNIHFPANPPKKGEKSINIIYHDENYKIFQESINKDARRFEEACKGTFIFSNSMEIFKTIIQEIQSKNAIQTINKFLLITTGRTFEKVVEFLNSNPQYSELISKACIYCMRKKNI